MVHSSWSSSRCIWFRGETLVIPLDLPSITVCGRASTDMAMQLLPEANLRQLLALLPLSQRIRSAELVSKQWRQALLDQQVLSVLDFARDDLWRRQVCLLPATGPVITSKAVVPVLHNTFRESVPI